VIPLEFLQLLYITGNSVFGLPFGENRMIVGLCWHYTTKWQTDKQTEPYCA